MPRVAGPWMPVLDLPSVILHGSGIIRTLASGRSFARYNNLAVPLAWVERAEHGHRHRPWGWNLCGYRWHGRAKTRTGAMRAADAALRALGWTVPPMATEDDITGLLRAAEALR